MKNKLKELVLTTIKNAEIVKTSKNEVTFRLFGSNRDYRVAKWGLDETNPLFLLETRVSFRRTAKFATLFSSPDLTQFAERLAKEVK